MYESAALFALCAAFMLALRDTFGRLAVQDIHPVSGSWVTAIAGLAALGAVSAALGDFRTPLPPPGWLTLYIAIAGVLRITAARASRRHPALLKMLDEWTPSLERPRRLGAASHRQQL